MYAGKHDDGTEDIIYLAVNTLLGTAYDHASASP